MFLLKDQVAHVSYFIYYTADIPTKNVQSSFSKKNVVISVVDISILKAAFFLFHLSELGDAAPLFLAVDNGHVELVRRLLAFRADPHHAEPLRAAAESGSAQLVRMLLEAGGENHRENHRGNDPDVSWEDLFEWKMG